MIDIKIRIVKGKAKYIETKNATPFEHLEDGLYYGGLEIYTKIKDTVTRTCAKTSKRFGFFICTNTFEVKGKSNTKYCEEHRRKSVKK